MTTNNGMVVWVTGYSSAGKTTVSRLVDKKLQLHGLRTLHLDGDDLRSIFGKKWGYSREDRLELSRVYFRLCSHLSTQGCIVIISAIAMYDEVRKWLREHVPNTVEIYLKVPDSELLARDSKTKGVYDDININHHLYDEPSDPDLIVENYSDITPHDSANIISKFIIEHDKKNVSHGRETHWNSYYSTIHNFPPSSFAQFVIKYFPKSAKVLEVGCGNGRDASYFSNSFHHVTGIDISVEAIKSCRKISDPKFSEFVCASIDEFKYIPGSYDVVYSRFSLHALTNDEELSFLKIASESLRNGGILCIECRSINDPLSRMGDVISKNERVYGHYRRFIIKEDITEQLSNYGFIIEYIVESDNLAKHNDDNPVVLRIICSKAL